MRAMIYAVNARPQTVLAEGAVLPGAVVHSCGCVGNCAYGSVSSNGVEVRGVGCHDISATIDLVPAAAGTITATLYADGVAIPGATASATVAAADTEITLPLIGCLKKVCCNAGLSNITCVLSAEATVNNYAIKVVKE